jgi:hypothetical protein
MCDMLEGLVQVCWNIVCEGNIRLHTEKVRQLIKVIA